MPRYTAPGVLLVAVIALTGCPAAPSTQASAPPGTKAGTAVKATTPATAAKTVAIDGTATGSAGLVAAGGGNVLSHNGGTMVAAGAGNMVAAGAGNFAPARGLLALSESKLTNAEVFLGDAQGKPIAGVASVATGADGRFKLTGVPATGTYTVNVRVKTAKGAETTLVTLVQPEKEASVDVSTASTCVAVDLLGDGSKALAAFDPTIFKSIIEAIRTRASAERLPDIADRAAIRAWLASEFADLKAQLNVISGQLTAISGQLGTLNGQLGVVNGQLGAVDGRLGKLEDMLNNAGLGTPAGGAVTPAPTATTTPTTGAVATAAPASPLPTPIAGYVPQERALTISPPAPLVAGGAQLVTNLSFRGRLKYKGGSDPDGVAVAMRLIADPRSTDSKNNLADLSLVANFGDAVTFTFTQVEVPARYRIQARIGSDPAQVDMTKKSLDQVGYLKVEKSEVGVSVSFDREPDEAEGRLTGIFFSPDL